MQIQLRSLLRVVAVIVALAVSSTGFAQDSATKEAASGALKLAECLLREGRLRKAAFGEDAPGWRPQLVCTGALTNAALALSLYPELAGLVDVVLMGGAWTGGNTGPAAEFNIQVDPEAAQIVMQSGARVTMVPLEGTHTALATPAVVERIRERPWAEVDGCGVLPEKLPEPPPAARWWAGAALACLLAVLAGVFALRDVPPEPSYPVLVEATRDGAIIEADLGVHDDAYLLVVARQGEELLLLHASEQPWDKARYATGEGDYSLAVEADEVLVASSSTAFEEVDLAAANLAVMVLQIQSSHQDADIFVHTGI